MAYGRIVRLFVGRFQDGNNIEGEDVLDLSQFDIEFDVSRSIEYYDNEATITVFNLSPSAIRSLMEEGNGVVLQAGHEDQSVGNIFVGQIGLVKSRRRTNGTIETTMHCVSSRGAFYQLARLNCSFSFAKGTPAKQCLDALCSYAQIALRAGFESELSKGIPYDYQKSGSFNDVIRDFTDYVLFPYYQKRLFWDNNELIVHSKINRHIELEEIVLDYEDGALLSAEEIRDENANKVNFGDDPAYYYFSGSDVDVEPKQSKAKKIDRTRRVQFTALISPMIAPNCFVNIDSTTGSDYDGVIGIKGRFLVMSCEFRGRNNGGEFTVECQAMEVEGVQNA